MQWLFEVAIMFLDYAALFVGFFFSPWSWIVVPAVLGPLAWWAFVTGRLRWPSSSNHARVVSIDESPKTDRTDSRSG